MGRLNNIIVVDGEGILERLMKNKGLERGRLFWLVNV